MALPINIDDLINGRTVEWERIELKEGWNPDAVLHTLCAFANDINNWGGGYIVIGIEENDGQPVLPPKGLKQNQIDSIQKKLLELCYRITPNYFPLAEPVLFQGKHILVIWAPGGDTRPYKAPISLSERSLSIYYVRRFSHTVKASVAEEKQLIELAAKVPFDDRINHQAELSQMQLPLIQSFLKEVGSHLVEDAARIPFEELCRRINVARGPSEYVKPVNAGLLFFTEKPELFFRGAKIEIIEYQDDIGDNFSEKSFTGPIHQQLKDALSYIEKFIIKEEVRKIPRQLKTERFYNYPFEAVKEALANAVYHRSYEHLSSIEVNIRLDCIEILSFPGPVSPINNALLKKPRVIGRDYRNRRVGDFLKELHMTEGRATGIPKIRRAMEKNGSPKPKFETDAEKTYFLTTLRLHPKVTFKRQQKIALEMQVKDLIQPDDKAQVEAQVEAQVKITNTIKDILRYCNAESLSSRQIAQKLGHKTLSGNIRKALPQLVEMGLLAFTIPNKPQSRLQKYRTTAQGMKLIKGSR